MRRKIAAECERQSPLEGVLELDESYFGPQRVRGRCGRGAGGKTIVFGLLKRGDSIYTAIVPNVSKAALQAVIRGRASLNSVVHTDGWAGYHGLVDLGFDKHLRVEHRDDIFAQQLNHINESRASGASPNDVWPGSAAYPTHLLPSFERNRIPLQPQTSGPLQSLAKLPQKGPALKRLLPKPHCNSLDTIEQNVPAEMDPRLILDN